MNERVRAIKARRDGTGSEVIAQEPEPQPQERRSRIEAQASARHAEPHPTQGAYPRETRTQSAQPFHQTAAAPFTASQPAPVRRGSQKETDTIVQAALTRVKRATENASRASLPKIEPARTPQPAAKGALALDREATPRAFEPAPEIPPRASIVTSPLPEIEEAAPAIAAREEKASTGPLAARAEAFVEASPAKTVTSPLPCDLPEILNVQPIDEIEPLDYLEAEIRKVDKALGLEFDRSESPTLGTHVAIGIIDLFTIAISCTPFVGLAIISNMSLTEGTGRIAAIILVLMVSFFYLALTQCICGKTFGMMLTNTRVVDGLTYEPITPSRALLRTAGYYVSAAPFMLGFLWAAISRKHRGWHDYISGSQVSRDF